MYLLYLYAVNIGLGIRYIRSTPKKGLFVLGVGNLEQKLEKKTTLSCWTGFFNTHILLGYKEPRFSTKDCITYRRAFLIRMQTCKISFLWLCETFFFFFLLQRTFYWRENKKWWNIINFIMQKKGICSAKISRCKKEISGWGNLYTLEYFILSVFCSLYFLLYGI